MPAERMKPDGASPARTSWRGEGQATYAVPEVFPLPVKTWSCPNCHKDFVVDSESARDTCPWCSTTVEDKNGDLKAAPNELPPDAGRTGDPPPSSAGEQKTAEKAAASANQAWWPFEYSS